MTRFQNNFLEMFLLCPLTKIAKMIPFGLTRWPPELKIEKGVDCHASVNNLLKRHLLLNRLIIILQECFLSDLYQNAKMVPFRYTKWHPEQKKKKKRENL